MKWNMNVSGISSIEYFAAFQNLLNPEVSNIKRISIIKTADSVAIQLPFIAIKIKQTNIIALTRGSRIIWNGVSRKKLFSS